LVEHLYDINLAPTHLDGGGVNHLEHLAVREVTHDGWQLQRGKVGETKAVSSCTREERSRRGSHQSQVEQQGREGRQAQLRDGYKARRAQPM
jgi:hypothetical protein